MRSVYFSAVMGLALAACSQPVSTPAQTATIGEAVDADGFHAATAQTAAANAAVAAEISFDDGQDFEDALRGRIAHEPDLEILGDDGTVIWRPSDYAFLETLDAASVNPSLLRQARLNSVHGLFEVTDGVYQVRGYDLANMSLIEGDTGWIIIDPLTTVETARAALDIANRTLGERPITGIIFTHSHIDHFGGVEGITSAEALASGAIPIIAPEGFTNALADENVMGGAVMGRRASYMYGFFLPRSPRGHVDAGLGKSPARGTFTTAQPTIEITQTGQTLSIDGVDMEFQNAPNTEAPATLTVYFPEFRVWTGADIVARTMHNLYTLRGAKVRDAVTWSDKIEEARLLFGDRTDIAFYGHGAPVFGQANVDQFLRRQSDLYRYIHDQTIRLASLGLRPDEIAETIELPAQLTQDFTTRAYYGTLKHNARAVYQYYFGWFDGVPAHLDPLPRTEAASRYVEAMGGLEAILEQSRSAFEAGEHRWGAELAQHAVFARPDSADARALLARHYEQLGYRAEATPWRDIYLTGAMEARNGPSPFSLTAGSDSILNVIPLENFFMAMAANIDGMRAAERDTVLNFIFNAGQADEEIWVVSLSNGVMRYVEGEPVEDADATVNVTRAFWMRLIAQDAGLMDMITSTEFSVEGDRAALLGFFALLNQADGNFAIVEP